MIAKPNALLLFLCLGALSCFGQLPSYVPNLGLIGWYPFNGDPHDHSGNGYLGTGNAVLAEDRFGMPNAAYSFNGIDQFIHTNFPGITGAQARTISAWAKTAKTSNQNLIMFGPNEPPGARFDLLMNLGAPGVTAGTSHGAVTYAAPNAHDDNWHHYVIRLQSYSLPAINQVEVFMDGVKLSSVVYSFRPATILNTIGRFMAFADNEIGASPFKFKGCLDDIGIWNRALSDEEIGDLFRTPAPGIIPCNAYGSKAPAYPNPAVDILIIENPLPQEPVSVVAFNLLGQLVFAEKDLRSEFLYIGDWPSGVYYFQISNSCGEFLVKLVKQR